MIWKFRVPLERIAGSFVWFTVIWLAGMGLVACFGDLETLARAQQETKRGVHRLESKNLSNAMWVSTRVLSGGLPEGKPAFEELAGLGIKTIISVDGIKPDVVGAKSAGLRYVHLPHGYDGISGERLMQIAKAVRDLPGPVYIHCHHGRHRSPAASAAVCIALGQLSVAEGREVLRVAGTNPGFRGLIQAVENAAPIAEEQLDGLKIEFAEVSDVPPIVESMVAMEVIFDRLMDHQRRGWNNVDPESLSDALMLKEHYIELHRSESERKQEADFLRLLEQGRAFAEQLESHLQTDRDLESAQRASHADGAIKLLANNCSQCHRLYRDNR